MHITEVRIKLTESGEDRLRGFCSVTFDDAFVVRDLKIIEGNNGPFVAMPSRKLTSNCQKCHTKNHLRSNYCNNCGTRQNSDQVTHDTGGRAKLYADIAHPVNAQCREMIQTRVIEELEKELELSRQPGYFSRYDDGYDHLAAKKAKPAPVVTEVPSDAVEPATTDTTDSRSSPAADAGVQTRSDAGHSPSEVRPHRNDSSETTARGANSDKPDNPNVSQGRSKPEPDDFGKGIFD